MENIQFPSLFLPEITTCFLSKDSVIIRLLLLQGCPNLKTSVTLSRFVDFIFPDVDL